MARIEIGVLSEDREYVERLIAYIRLSEYRSRVTAVRLTDEGHCMDRLRQCGDFQVLLINGPLSSEGRDSLEQSGCRLILLRENESAGHEYSLELEKYQPLDKLLSSVLDSSGIEEGETIGGPQTGRAFVLAVYSAVGGAGKTVFAHTSSALLARMGYRPLIITLEGAVSSCWRTAGEDFFGRVLYETAKNAPAPTFNLERYFVNDPARRVSFLPGAANPDELEQMGAEETGKLLRLACASSKADMVILDLDNGRHARTEAALLQSDRIVWLVPANRLAIDKTKVELKLWEQRHPGIRKRISLLVNMGRSGATEEMLHDLEADDMLPYQQEWQWLNSIQELDVSTLYHDRLNRWLAYAMNEAGMIPGKAVGR